MAFIIEIPNGGETYWIADWKGDPGRTVIKEYARRYQTKQAAQTALTMAQKLYGDYRPSLLHALILTA